MISPGDWSTALLAELQAQGLAGPDLANFASAVGDGSESSVIGKTFTTTDSGQTSSAGTGTGTGITGIVGIVGATIASAIFASCTSSFGQSGPDLMKLCTAVGNACVSVLGTATLNSTHSTVYSGSGTIDLNSIDVDGATWGSAIASAGAFTGPSWTDLANAIGNACADHVKASGTGSLTITGSPPPTPVAGSGTGTGTIS